jgi:hypothetical protein
MEAGEKFQRLLGISLAREAHLKALEALLEELKAMAPDNPEWKEKLDHSQRVLAKIWELDWRETELLRMQHKW